MGDPTITASRPSNDPGQDRLIAEMLDSFGDGFIAFDADWRITHCNRGGAAHYGLKRQDMVGRIAWEVPSLEDDTALREFLERARTTGEAIDVEAPSELKPGSWFYLRAFPLEGGVGLSSRDVTDRHEQTRREREYAERLDLALGTAGYGDWSWDVATDEITFSSRAAEVMGTRSGAVGSWTGLLTLMDAEDQERSRVALEQALVEHSIYELEFRFSPPGTDEQRWVKVRARWRHAADGAPAGLLGVITDITEAKAEADAIRADRARLAESEARFRAMADSAPSPVWVTDERGGLEFANRAFREMAGRPLEKLSGDQWLNLLHPDDRARIEAMRAGRRGRVLPGSWEARFDVHGEWRWLRTASQPRFDDAGAFQGYVGLAMDITDAHLAEERQRLLINELNHRVKNTLATIQSLARQTLREGVSVAEGRERLTERLLALSAAHNVLTQGNWESADLAEIARQAVRPYDEPVGEHIVIEGPPTRLAPNVALALSMALHELATNGVKYGALSAPGGRVRLTWSPVPEGGVAIEWRESGGPAVTAPTSKGFGSRLLAGLTAELGAPAEIDYAPVGLVCRLRAPAA